MGVLWIQILIISLLLLSRTSAQDEHDENEHDVNDPGIEYPPYDGWYNNRAAPDWGAAETPLLRRLPAAYSDGAYAPSGEDRPNPMLVSRIMFNGSTGTFSFNHKTALLVFFGQQVVEEILDAQRPGCPREYMNVVIPKDDIRYNPDEREDREMPFIRSRFDQRTGLSPNNPRQQLNEISAWLDGSLTYGPNKAWADALRSFKDGLMLALNDSDSSELYVPAKNDIRLPFANPPPPVHHRLKPINRFYRIGNPRGNENPFLLTFGIMWFRYHNLKARQIKSKNPNWSDERIFNEARKWTIAVHQKIVIYDWLPSWLGNNSALDDYKFEPGLNPNVMHVFQSAAMRFGHTLVVPGVYLMDKNGNVALPNTLNVDDDGHIKAIRTCNSYWEGTNLINKDKGVDIDDLLRGMGHQLAEGEDMIITPDLRDAVFGPLEFSRRDLMAINIQRARDHGLPDYNTARREFGLEPVTNFSQINPLLAEADPELFKKISELYNGSVDDLDIWPAGMLETRGQYLADGETPGPGPLFRAIIKDQFTRIRNGDRFWFENNKINKLFTDDEIEEIHNTTLLDVILSVTNITREQFENRTNLFFYDSPNALKVTAEEMAECTEVKHFDYFSGSEVSFALTFTAVAVWLFICIGLLVLCAKLHQREVQKEQTRDRRSTRRQGDDGTSIAAVEWVGHKEDSRNVKIKFNTSKHVMLIQTEKGALLRTIDLSHIAKSPGGNSVDFILSADKNMRTMCARFPKEYDVVLRCDNATHREESLQKIQDFVKSVGVATSPPRSLSENVIYKQAITKQERKNQLEKFFKSVFNHAFKLDVGEDFDTSTVSAAEARDLFSCELTKYEFADALSLKHTSLFVENMFVLVDKDNNGYISFREFLDVIVMFRAGSAKDKAKMLFDMYDLNCSNTLTRDEFKTMLKSLMDLANAEVDEQNVNHLLDRMYRSARLENKEELTFEDFNNMLGDEREHLNYAFLDIGVSGVSAPKANAPSRARKTVFKSYGGEEEDSFSDKRKKRMSHLSENIQTIEKEYPRGPVAQRWNAIQRYMENNRLKIFWRCLYTLVVIGTFVERAYYYSIEREHVGLRGICGYGVSITRGAASAMMLTYSSLLVTMCRNTITFLRETFLHRFFPFDDAIELHKYIAVLAMIFTVCHAVGHGFNFYHIATQPADDLNCYFRNFFHATDELPKFHYWCWQTITGFTGVFLTLQVFLMYTFSIQYARRNAFKWFWYIHNSYVVLFLLMTLHGAGRLVQAPFFYYFFLGPVILFTLDKLVSVTRKKVEIAVLKAELLPSEVTNLQFKRPSGFEYRSGQWVRIACIPQGAGEYHPFTLTSAPHEDTLSLHIRAVGPWTMNLRRTYDIKESPLPKIYLDGPYGEGHQDWYKYDVAVLVGGGIGVTPFASILKDIAHRSSTGAKISCKKVYFVWVTRTQKHFEWMTDIIKDVEENDTQNIVSVHIFITQFKQKFDIRTTMLYICERHFQKISNRSLFTGLRSITHFGRPNFHSFFQLLLAEHSSTNVFGVFSCGPPPMTHGVEKACSDVNKYTSDALFVHHFENF